MKAEVVLFRLGTYRLGGQDVVVTREMLHEMVQNQTRVPVTIGFDPNAPAVGMAENLRLIDNGETLVGTVHISDRSLSPAVLAGEVGKTRLVALAVVERRVDPS